MAVRQKQFKHGIGGYRHHKCRCAICLVAKRVQQQRYAERKLRDARAVACTHQISKLAGMVYRRLPTNPVFDKEDLQQEAFKNLLLRLHKFDPKQAALNTFANKHIYYGMLEFLGSRAVHPLSQQDQRRVKAGLFQMPVIVSLESLVLEGINI